MSTDLTTAPRSQRDRLADRTDVLDKVGVLRMLPDDMHVTTDMVAEFYGVDISTVRQTVNRNREELDSDGYDVLTRAEVSDKLSLTPDELGMPRTAGSLAMFPRRAVLRVGMLLRDSPIARQRRANGRTIRNCRTCQRAAQRRAYRRSAARAVSA